ncbi:hypothetical protein LTR98_002263 [Exophiala xenobiotica]|nr:hypothetical protein LTR98_002263 [Exophiala xenobiotica]KAK5444030.1 hypothetical protein LTR18_005291 [Exophiala xenobiotica]
MISWHVQSAFDYRSFMVKAIHPLKHVQSIPEPGILPYPETSIDLVLLTTDSIGGKNLERPEDDQ